MKSLLALTACLSFAGATAVFAQCSGGSCGGGGGSFYQPPTVIIRRPAPPEKKVVKKKAPTIIEKRRQPIPNFGVETDRLRPSATPRYYGADGEPISRERAYQEVEKLTDDSSKPRLSAIAVNSADLTRLSQDFSSSPELAPWRDKVLFQAYSADDPMVRNYGFVTSGKPTIYYQTPGGKVLHRQDDYTDGPAGLALALREADKSYDANKDIDLRRSSPSWSLFGLPLIPIGSLLAAILALMSLKNKQ